MPIYLDVGAKADERSFKSAADKAEKYFDDASGRIGKSFSDNLSKGLKSSDDAIRKSAESAAKAYDKAADAAGKVVVEERKLDDLRAKGAGGTAIVAQVERLDKARRAEVSSTRAAVTALNDLDNAQRTAAVSGSALSNLLAGISQGAAGTRFGALAGQAESLATKLGGISPMAAGATLGVAAMVTGVVAATKALYDLGAQWDDVADGITGRTGKMGADLDSVMGAVERVSLNRAVATKDIGQIAAGVSQSLHLTGAPLQQMTQQLADLQQVTGQVVDTRELGKVFRLYDVEGIQAQTDAVGQLRAMSQATDIPINQLLTTLGSAGKYTKQLGLNLQETAGLFSVFEEAGLGTEKVGASLAIALKKLAKDSDDPVGALDQLIDRIRQLHDAQQEGAAQSLAASYFGRDYGAFLKVIESGELDIEKLHDAVRALGNDNSLGDQKKKTEDWRESLEKSKHTLSYILKPAADFTFTAINTGLEYSTFLAKKLAQAFSDIPDSLPQVGPITPDSPLGQLILPVPPPPVPGSVGGTALPGSTGSVGPIDRRPNGPWGTYWPDDKKKKDSAKLPDAPVLPYDTSVPGWAIGLPASQLNSYMNAHNELLGSQARLNQIKDLPGAKPDDIQRATNDVIKATQGLKAAEQALADARHSAYDKEKTQLQSHAAAMDEFGAKLDADFGISKGWPGIFENIFKFVANLATAPLQGLLGAVAKANPNEGSGLVGMLAANGSFGPQYTPAAIAAANSQGLTGGADQASTALNGLASAAYSATGALGGGGSTAAYPASAGRVPYGLPHGSNSGGYGGGGVQFPDWVNQLADQFGIKPSTYPGHQESSRGEAGFAPNPQGLNRAIDWSGPVANMERFADYLATIPQDLEQVIWQNPQTGHRVGIAGGQDVSGTGYYAGDYGGHGNHVHTRQSMSIPLPGAAGGGWWPDLAGASTGGGTGTGAGPFGYLPQAAPFGAGQYGTGMPTPGGAPAGGGWPWLGTPPISSGQGTGPAPGPGMGTGMQPPAAGGPGFQFGGGAIGMAEGAAAMAADLFAPGSGAAVQMASQLINRAIQFGGQAAGIGVSGLMDFFSVGDNPKGAIGNSWLGKLAGGIAGARPALPNMAGQKPPADQLSGPKQPGPVGNSAVNNHVTINNHAATEEGNGRDAVRQLEAMAARPGLHG